MDGVKSNSEIITRLYFRLLPVQILISAVGAVNGIVDGLFASNAVGEKSMSAIALYTPFNLFMTAICLMFVCGSQLLCGKYMGAHQLESTQRVFNLDVLVSLVFSVLMTLIHCGIAAFGLTSLFTPDAQIRGYLKQYFLGQAVGCIPLIMSQQMGAFLSLENKTHRVTIASVCFIAVNTLLDYLFTGVMGMEAFGLSLATSLGFWVFFLIQLAYFFSGKSLLRFSFRGLKWKDAVDIVRVGFSGALSQGYQALRSLLVNGMITAGVGAAGLSAFAANNLLMNIFWAIPAGMLLVSRMLIGVSVGEEDRQTLTDVMKNMLTRCVPIMCAIAALIILCARPLTELFYHTPSEPVYQMTLASFRIIPICMPFSVILMHFVCYGQASGKQFLVQLLSALDGVVCVAGFAALLMPWLSMNSVYVANILNGLVTTLVIILYAWVRNRRAPRTIDELMVIPKDFGVSEDERMDLSLNSMDQVITVSRQVSEFCERRGIDHRRSFLAGLCLEEMAGNVVAHGFHKDQKKHMVDIRVAHKDDDLILRIKDNCIPFDPADRMKMTDPEDKVSNIGIRMVYDIASSVVYQNILGLNVLTIRI